MKVNPEQKFISNSLKAYEGMKVEEYSFTQMENYKGEVIDYKLDIISSFEPANSPRPVVIFVHGGGFCSVCDKRQGYIPMFARYLTKAGYVVISPDYPVFDNIEHRSTYTGFDRGAKKAAEAVHKAYEFIHTHASVMKFDSENIAIMGGSAGGMTAFYLLEHYKDAFRMFVNCWGCPGTYMPNVIKFPPTLSIHGTGDEAVPYNLEAPIQKEFEKYGIDNKLITLDGAPHTPMMHLEAFIPIVLEWLEKYMR